MKDEFAYKGLVVKRDYCHTVISIDCDDISDSEMQTITGILYQILRDDYLYSEDELKGGGYTFKDKELLFLYNEELKGILINNGAEYI